MMAEPAARRLRHGSPVLVLPLAINTIFVVLAHLVLRGGSS